MAQGPVTEHTCLYGVRVFGLLTCSLPEVLKVPSWNTPKVKNTYLLQSCARIHLIRGLLDQKITEVLSNTRHSLFNVPASHLPHKGNIHKSFISTGKASEGFQLGSNRNSCLFLEMSILKNKNRFMYFCYKIRRPQFHLFLPNQTTNIYQPTPWCISSALWNDANSLTAAVYQHRSIAFCRVYTLEHFRRFTCRFVLGAPIQMTRFIL